MVSGEKTYDELKREQEGSEDRQASPQREVEDSSFPAALEEGQQLIQGFYEKEKEKWAISTFSKEDIKSHFSPEHLASLSLEDYILLMRRFPSQMVTHVTRQGIRDHLGAVNHFEGVNKFWNGFKEIAENGRLKNWLSLHLTEDAKEEAIAEFLELRSKTKEEALQVVNYVIGEDTQNFHGSFADRTALHLATEEVADAHYGAETGNEIFFAYPSAFIASQYVFSGQLAKADGGYHNNQWVWANEDRGLDINTGIVFIPEETLVDRRTGSKYELDENLQPKQNTKIVNEIKTIISRDSFKKFAEQHAKILGETTVNINRMWSDEESSDYMLRQFRPTFDEIRRVLSEQFGINDQGMQRILLDYGFLRNAQGFDAANGDTHLDFISDRVTELGFKFEPAKYTVSAQEYWETYFKDHPEQRPSKVVYYKGDDPTRALKNWRKENKLFKGSNELDLGFSENRLNTSKPEEVRDKLPFISRFKSIAEGVIEKYYANEPNGNR